MRNRLIIIIVPFFLLLVGIGTILFLRSRKTSAPELTATPPASVAQITPTTTPDTSASRLRLLADESVISVMPSFGGQAVWYINATGTLVRLDLGTMEKSPFGFPETITNPTSLLWQNRGSDLLVFENQKGHERTKYYDALAKKFVPYPEAQKNSVFLAGNKQIAYDWVSTPPKAKTPKHELKTSDLDGRNFKKIGDLFQPDNILRASPAKQQVVMYSKTSGPLLLVDLATRKFQTIDQKDSYTGVKFSPDGENILVSVKNDSGTEQLRLYNLSDFKKTDLDFPGLKLAASVWTEDSKKLIYINSDGVLEIDAGDITVSVVHALDESEKISVHSAVLAPEKNALLLTAEGGGLYMLNYSR